MLVNTLIVFQLWLFCSFFQLLDFLVDCVDMLAAYCVNIIFMIFHVFHIFESCELVKC